jgi:hypothetical protein
VLAILGRRRPIVIAAGLLGVEALASLAVAPPNPFGLLIHALVIVHLVRAWRRMGPRQPRPTLAQVFE